MPRSLLGSLRAHELSAQERRLAGALQAHPELFAFGSIRQLGRRLDVTPAAILRFAHALGLSGFRALQAEVRRERQADAARHAADAGTVERLETARACHQASLDRVHRGVDPGELARAAALLCDARRLLLLAFCGAGDPLTSLLAAGLEETGLAAELVCPDGAEWPDLVSRGDAVVAASGDPFGQDALAGVLETACGRGAVTIAVGPSIRPPLAAAATLVLALPAIAEADRSIVAAVALVELLTGEVAGRR